MITHSYGSVSWQDILIIYQLKYWGLSTGLLLNYGTVLPGQSEKQNQSQLQRKKSKILQRSSDMNSDKKMTIKNEITIRTKGLGR